MRALFPNRKLLSLAPLELPLEARILDVGCGAGWRLYALREAGFANLLGVDPFLPEDIIHDNGLQIRKKRLDEVEGTWDVVMFHHSFEHVPEPRETLGTASRLLRSRGICLVRIPTVDSYAWEHYREQWYQIDAPRHFFLHSQKSIGLLAERESLHVDAVRYDSTLDQFWKSELNACGGDPARLAAGRKEKRQWRRTARMLNREGRGDQAAFYLVKK